MSLKVIHSFSYLAHEQWYILAISSSSEHEFDSVLFEDLVLD